MRLFTVVAALAVIVLCSPGEPVGGSELEDDPLCPAPIRFYNRACLDVEGVVGAGKVFTLHGRHEPTLPANVVLNWDAGQVLAYWSDPKIVLSAPVGEQSTIATLSFSSIHGLQKDNAYTNIWAILRDENNNVVTEVGTVYLLGVRLSCGVLRGGPWEQEIKGTKIVERTRYIDLVFPGVATGGHC
jgi:hypothetical protein